MVKRLTPNAEEAVSIPGLKTKILRATWPKEEKEKSSVIQYFNSLKMHTGLLKSGS